MYLNCYNIINEFNKCLKDNLNIVCTYIILNVLMFCCLLVK